MRAIHVVGGGPAGVMAASAAMREGAPVRIFEKSAFPRHKVCGEFLSPAILPLLRPAGCETGFLQLRPSILSAMRLHLGTRVIRHPLPEPAYGLSRAFNQARVVTMKVPTLCVKHVSRLCLIQPVESGKCRFGEALQLQEFATETRK